MGGEEGRSPPGLASSNPTEKVGQQCPGLFGERALAIPWGREGAGPHFPEAGVQVCKGIFSMDSGCGQLLLGNGGNTGLSVVSLKEPLWAASSQVWTHPRAERLPGRPRSRLGPYITCPLAPALEAKFAPQNKPSKQL